MDPITKVIEVMRDHVQDVEERCDNYQSDLVICLIEVLKKRDEGLSDTKRRKEVTEIVEAFGNAVAAKQRVS